MSRLVRLAVTAGLLAAYLTLLISAVAALAVPFFVAAVVAVAAELVLSRRAPHLLPESLTAVLSSRFRVLSLDVLTALLAARLLPDAGTIVALAIVAVLLLAGGRDLVGVFARRVNWRRAGGPVSWRNLPVAGLPEPQPLRPTTEPDGPFTVLTLLIPLGYAIGETTDRYGAAIAAQWIVIAVVVLVLGGRAVQYRALNRMPHDVVRERVRAAIEAHRPEVVLHHSGRRGTVEQVLLWVPALLALERPCLVVVREQSHLEALDGCGVPVVWAPRSQDVELFMVPTVDLALYPSDSTNINNHLLRVPGVYDVLIGHGDSDEPESRSPIARMYDEVWVAGPAGAARYDYPVSGVPASKVKQIGPVRPVAVPAGRGQAGRGTASDDRPAVRVGRGIAPDERPAVQVGRGSASDERPAIAAVASGGRRTVLRPPVDGPAAGERPTVVYAPTWEAPVDAVDVSSLLTHGRRILDALLARQDVRVVFVPAAPTGARLPVFAAELERLRGLVAARPEHAVVAPDRLRGMLADTAFAIADVSPALTEVVRADVPFAVPAIGSLADAAMHLSFPMTAAGAILRRYPEDVFAALDDALGPDTRAADRLALGRTIDSAGDFERRFRSAVDDAIATQRRRRAFARPGV